MFRIISVLCFAFVLTLSGQSQDIGQLQKSLDTAKSPITKADILNELAPAVINNDPEEARKYSEEALQLSKSNGYKDGIAFALQNLANVHYYLDEYNEGLAKLDSAQAIFEETGNKKGLGYVANSRGEILTIMGDYGDALQALFEALSEFEAIQDKLSLSRVNINIGLIHYYQNNLDEALKYFNQSLVTADEVKTGDASLYIGRVYVDQHNYSEAQKFLQKALDIAMKYGDKYVESDCYFLLGTIDANYGETDLALARMQKCLVIKEELEDGQGIALACNKIGGLYLQKKDPVSAEKFYCLSRDIAQSIGVREELKDACLGLSNTYNYLKQFDSAYHYLNEHNRIYEELLSEEASKKLAQLEAALAAEKRETEIEAERKIESFIRQVILWSGIFIILVFAGLAYMMFTRYKMKKRANEQLAKYNAEILHQRDIIEEKNRDILASINYAKRIQDAILPAHEVMAKNLTDYFIFFRPKDIVSGDFYWAHMLAPGKVLYAAVDCTGHGVPGAFMSIVGFNGLNQAVKEFGISQPALILDKLNELVEDTFRSHEDANIKDGMDITLCLADRQHDGTTRLEFAAANNPLWIIRHGDSPVFEEIKADKQPIGSYLHRKPFTNHSIILRPGDSVYIFSDGYADQFGGDKGKKFKYAHLREILEGMYSMPMENQRGILEKSIDEWMHGEYEQIDDMCVIGIKA